MTSDLPPPVETPDFYLKAIHDRLGELLDRLPSPPEGRGDGTVELREPAVSAPASGGKGATVSRRSPPHTPQPGGGNAPSSAPTPAKPTAASATGPRKATTSPRRTRKKGA